MKLIVWNCQGIGGDLTVDNLLEQNRRHTPDIVILLETKNKSSRYEFLKRRLDMNFMFAVEPKGIGGGLCVLWKDESQIVLLKSEEFMIEVRVWDATIDKHWRLFAIYASTDERRRREQWKNLSKRINYDVNHCLLIGDFNDILCNDEKEGGNTRPSSSLRDFRDFVARNELLDLGFEGYPFTWRNNHDSLPIQQRLDRGLATPDWRCTSGGSHAFRLCEKMKTLRMSLKEWYRGRGNNSKKAIDQLKVEIRRAYESNQFASDQTKIKEKELRTAHKEEEAYWKLKSRNQWLKEGDKNTKFFHAQTVRRRTHNKIKGLEDCHGVWHEDEKEICDIASSYFTGLFRSSRPSHIGEITECMENRVSNDDNRLLTAPITDREIMEAAFQIPPTRAPGPDGFTGCFYKDHWETVGKDVALVVKAFWHSGKMLRKLNHTNLVLIPKVKCPKNMAQFRPIALCNVIYKIIAKLVTNRLKSVMPKIIGEYQSAFVAGKQIQDNILVVHEVLHSLLHQKNGNQEGMAIKLDMAKAYDRVEWNFLLSVMVKLGFAPMFCDRIKECISSVSFSFLINGSPTGHIHPERGLRQGDPLSPFLFLLCTEGFSSLIRKSMERGSLHGIRLTPSGNPLSHLFFADDSVLFGHATMEEAQGMVDVLNVYANGSGQNINLEKSSLFFGSTTSKRKKKKIGETLGIHCRKGFGKYLGLQSDFGMSKKVVFVEVREKIEARLAGWSEQFLSHAGKEVLVKAVAMALPNYAMSCFKLPIGVCRDVERAIRNYWWRGNDQKKGIHWISWDRLMRHKKMIQNPSSLLASMLREKYFPDKTFREAGKGKNTSWGWKGIFEARRVLQHGIRWRVGDGTKIKIRDDPWFPKPTTFLVKPRDCLQETMVSDLIEVNSRSWKREVILHGFSLEDTKHILSIPLSKFGCCDRLVWHHTVDGSYSVKTGYRVAVSLLENGDLGKKGRGAPSTHHISNQVWKGIWHLQVPNKIKFFLWRCCNKALAVRHNLKRRHMRIDNVCGVCNLVDESENHLFFRCDLSQRLWFCSPLHLNSIVLIGADFLDSWNNFCTSIKDREDAETIMQEFAFGLWRIWKNRNDVVFKGSHCHPNEILTVWRKNIGEYMEAMNLGSLDEGVVRPKLPPPMPMLWEKPKFGTFKLNTDASWCSASFRAGAGWVIRDFAGILHAAGGSGTSSFHCATAAEAHAIRTGLQYCSDYGFENVFVETDAKTVILMINKGTAPNCSFECILGDIEVLTRRLTSVTFGFVNRGRNRAAHSVAKFVFKKGKEFVWDHVGPEFLFNVLAQDVNISIRI
ncbi:unnamed protein product [Malus baccata var. baccata]